MSFINKQEAQTEVLSFRKHIIHSFRSHHKYEIVRLLQSDIPGICYNSIVGFPKFILQCFDQISSDFIDQSLCRNKNGEITVSSAFNLLNDICLGNEGFPHRCRSGITEQPSIQFFIYGFLIMEKVSVFITRNQHLGFIVTVVDSVHDIYNLKSLHDVGLKSSVIAGRRQNGTKIVLHHRIIRIQNLKKDGYFLSPDFMLIAFPWIRRL